jgi:outer membrane protein OmpA-like peptidoglycan-associated protein
MSPRGLLALLALGGCMKSADLPTLTAEVDAGLAQLSSDNWGEQCAPHDTAKASAHRDFATLEFEQGDGREAERHLLLAKQHLAEASRRADVCRPKDADGDKIWDHEDRCPAEAEVVNGYKDDDGCPEVDADGDKVYDDVDACPTEKEDIDTWQDDDGCPDPDNDGDGLLDVNDSCPLDPEDMNGYQDQDGCPEGKNDRDLDGIPDARDKCPDEPENINEYLDDDGCPDIKPENVRVTADRIEILEKVLFQTGRAVILPTSYGILDSVAQVLRDYPSIKVRIEGHTDNQGSDSLNKKLSDQRAKSVEKYLVDKGIATSRMTTEGVGEERPIDTNRTTEGRAANRRVEFHITDK